MCDPRHGQLFSTESESDGKGGIGHCGSIDLDVADSSDVLGVVVIMVGFNFGMLLFLVVLAAYQFSMADVLPLIRLVSTGQAPKLNLEKSQTFHLFLSHICAAFSPDRMTCCIQVVRCFAAGFSGQDQMAAVKREMLLLIHGVKVFLDVDGALACIL